MKILRIITSPRGNDSRSTKLGNAIVEKVQTLEPNNVLKVRNISANPLPHLDEKHLASFFVAKENRTPENISNLKYSETAIEEVFEADIIVIDVPMYNFGIPSTLKSWIDHLARAEKTFRYTKNGSEGLIKNKKFYLAIATGGVYSKGEMKNLDFTEPYLRSVLGFLGVSDITVFRVEGTEISDLRSFAMQKALESVNESINHKILD